MVEPDVAVPVTLSVYVLPDLPAPLPPVLPQATHHIVNPSAHIPRTARVRQRSRFKVAIRMESSATTANHNHQGEEGSLAPGQRHPSICEAAAVVTVTDIAVAELPLGVADEGETEQLAPVGAPVQVNDAD